MCVCSAIVCCNKIRPLLQIDRNNASAARLRGFEADLHLQGAQFPTILSILYVGYILMQIPSYVVFQLP